MEELEALIILSHLPHLGSVRIRMLIQHYGTALSVLKAPLEEIAAFFAFSSLILQSWKTIIEKKIWEKDIALAERTQTTLIPFTSPQYPKRLLQTKDFPVLLYMQGNYVKEDQRCLAIVGTRQASTYGVETAKKISRELARAGFTIVSGLAKGIDTAAHEGSLQGGRTFAVLGSGLSHLYPQENYHLALSIKQRGALISEFPMDAPPHPHHFPQRNRIVSGMALATIVIEAPQKSGAMLTAERAYEQGRPIFAFPGRCDSENHRGNHLLIKEGKAKLVENERDILQFFDELPLTGAIKQSPVVLEKMELVQHG